MNKFNKKNYNLKKTEKMGFPEKKKHISKQLNHKKEKKQKKDK